MKKFLILIFLTSIVLAGCGSKLTQEQLFEKKQECASYKDKIEKDIDGSNGTLETSIVLEQIFYSPKRNSCLYIYSTHGNKFSNRFLMDYLTKEGIIGYNDSSSVEKIIEFDTTVNELKGE